MTAADDPMTAAFLEGHRLKGLAVTSLNDLELYRLAAERFHEAGELAEGLQTDPAGDDQAKQEGRTLGPYYWYEEQRCLTSYFYEKRDTAKAAEHLEKGITLLSDHVDRLSQDIERTAPERSGRLTSILATARYYQRENDVLCEAIPARAAWDDGRFIDALDRYRRIARKHKDLIDYAKTLKDPAYERIALGNFIGAMGNCSIAMASHHLDIAGVQKDEERKTVPVDLACDLLRQMFQAYQYGMAAFDANPEWAQYREGMLLCRRNIDGFLKENRGAWRMLFARFLDQPEFLKIMAGIDLPLFTSLTKIEAGSPSSDGECTVEPPVGEKAKVETQRLLKLLFCLLDRGSGSSDDTLLFNGMSHEQLVRTFTDYVNQHRHYIGYCHIEQSHALNDRGVDIILRAQGGKIGFQIKSHFDVRQEDFAANVKRQYAESFAHGLDHYIILICCPFRKEGKVDLQQKVSHLLNELSSMKIEYHSAYGPLNTAKYFMGLPALTRDELLLRRAIDSATLQEFEKGYEHLPQVDDEEIRAAQAHFESFGEQWWDVPEGQEAFDSLNTVLKRKTAEQFTSRFLPTLPPDVKLRRSELIVTAQALLAACRECKSWSDRSEYKLPHWLDNVDDDMIPYTSMPNLLHIVQSLKRYLAVHKEMDAEMAQKVSEPNTTVEPSDLHFKDTEVGGGKGSVGPGGNIKIKGAEGGGGVNFINGSIKGGDGGDGGGKGGDVSVEGGNG